MLKFVFAVLVLGFVVQFAVPAIACEDGASTTVEEGDYKVGGDAVGKLKSKPGGVLEFTGSDGQVSKWKWDGHGYEQTEPAGSGGCLSVEEVGDGVYEYGLTAPDGATASGFFWEVE